MNTRQAGKGSVGARWSVIVFLSACLQHKNSQETPNEEQEQEQTTKGWRTNNWTEKGGAAAGCCGVLGLMGDLSDFRGTVCTREKSNPRVCASPPQASCVSLPLNLPPPPPPLLTTKPKGCLCSLGVLFNRDHSSRASARVIGNISSPSSTTGCAVVRSRNSSLRT